MKRLVTLFLLMLLLIPAALPGEAESFVLADALAGCGLAESSGIAGGLVAVTRAEDLECYGLTDYDSFRRFDVYRDGKYDGTFAAAFCYSDAGLREEIYRSFTAQIAEMYDLMGKAQCNPFRHCRANLPRYTADSWENDTEKLAVYRLADTILVLNGSPDTVVWLQSSLDLLEDMEFFG